MSALIFSDSHGSLSGMCAAIERHTPDTVLHLGDCARDAERLADYYPTLTIHSVSGNCDFVTTTPDARVIVYHGHKLLLTHGHRHGVKRSLRLLAEAAAVCHCEWAFFGHTHIAHRSAINGVTLCNPGSIAVPRSGPCSYGQLDDYDGALDFIVLPL